MPLPTDVAGAEGDFAAQVPADLLHEIEGLNAIQDTLGNRMFHVSRAWTDGPMRCTMHKSSGAKSNSSALPAHFTVCCGSPRASTLLQGLRGGHHAGELHGSQLYRF